jgi:hypothetical protein
MSGRIIVSKASARTMDGIVFASKAEMKRYQELRILERSGAIVGLVLQPPFILQKSFRHPRYGTQRAIKYVADFSYTETKTGQKVYEDCKGHTTEIYKLKKKILFALYPDIEFREVKA